MYTHRADSCTVDPMAEPTKRLNVTLDPAYAAKLAKMAERTHVNEGTLARSLLSQALDDADPDPRHIAELLDGLPGALERAREGLEDAKAGRTINLDDL
jgi:predicted transcriptional regulator